MDILRHLSTLRQVLHLPPAELCFDTGLGPGAAPDIAAAYRIFSKPHPRYRIIGNKTLGAALIDLDRFGGAPAAAGGAYLAAIQGKNRGAWHAQRARTRGYACREIDRNDHADAIHAINTALATRQGRPMDAKYLRKADRFDVLPHYGYYGVLDRDGRLVAYANIARYGNFSAFSQLMGLRNNDGIMHLLVVDIVTRLLAGREVRYVMYDTFFGARPGLRQFKTMLGFAPYHARYSLR
jgi:hypothetical protein